MVRSLAWFVVVGSFVEVVLRSRERDWIRVECSLVDIGIYVVQRVYLLDGLVSTDAVRLSSSRVQESWMVVCVITWGGVVVGTASAVTRVAGVEVRFRGRDDVRDRLLYRGYGVCLSVILRAGRS